MRGHNKRMPKAFDTETAAARFIEENDLAGYDEDFEDAEVKFEIRRETYLFPVSRRLGERINSLARRKRVSSEKLVERLISQGLARA